MPGDRALGRAARDIVFFVPFGIFLWRAVGTHLIFHGAGRLTAFPSFYTTWRFFTEHLSAPGGPVEYVSAFLSQLFHYPWLGAIVITLQAWTLGLCIAYLLRATTRLRLDVVRYVPALLLLIIYGRYQYFFPTTLALSFALALACLYVRLANARTRALAIGLFVVLSLIAYYASGGAFLLFGLICTIAELVRPGRRHLSLPYALLTAALPYLLGALVFGIDTANAYSDLLPISWELLHYEARRQGLEVVYAIYLLAPGIMIVGAGVSVLWTQMNQRLRRSRAEREETQNGRLKRAWGLLQSRSATAVICRWVVQTTAVIAIGVAVAVGSFDARKKTCFAVDYYASHQMWPQVLALGRKRFDDPFVMHAVNRALYHTGRLGDEMFQWPQRPHCLFLAGVTPKRALWATSGLYLEMGLLNAAEFALTECLEGIGDRPMIVQKLALVNLAKGNVGTARVYLGTLRNTLFHRHWAEHYIALLDKDPNLTTDHQVQQLRSIALDHDFLSVTPATSEMLARLLEKNPKNRMAFEYLMASHLLNGRLATFVKHMPQFRQIGYPTLPLYFEEAALTYVYGTGQSVYLGDYKPRAELQQQIQDFLGILARHRSNQRAALPELAPKYRDTYVFYYVYTQSEKARQRARSRPANEHPQP